MIDVHCHLAAEELRPDLPEVIARAREAGVVAAIVVGEHYEDNLRVLDLAAREPFVLPALGHHPWYLEKALEDVDRTLRLIEESREDLVAIGEVGLDYRVAESDGARASQRAVFASFIEASKALDLPLSVHVRSAGHYVLEMLEDLGSPRAALHAFDGKARYGREGAEAGYFFSIPGTVLVSRQKEKLVTALPAHRLLLESDAPALGPKRGERNEPAVLARVAQRVAELRGETAQEVAQRAFEASIALFGLDEERLASASGRLL